MDDKNLRNLTDIIEESMFRTEKKYTKGAEEHGGKLLEMSKEEFLEEMLDEVTDLLIYIITYRKLFIDKK